VRIAAGSERRFQEPLVSRAMTVLRQKRVVPLRKRLGRVARRLVPDIVKRPEGIVSGVVVVLKTWAPGLMLRP
jgi:hypothetical protein